MVDLNNTDEHLYDLVARDLKKKIREYYFGQEGKIPITYSSQKCMM